MNCSKCDSTTVMTTYYTRVCTECGLEHREHPEPELENVADAYNTLDTAYSRTMRFKNYLKQVTGVFSGCHYNAKIWSFLEKDAPFESITEMLRYMRQYKCKSKHYDCIYSFAKAFVPSEKGVGTLTYHQVKLVYRKFDLLLSRWKQLTRGGDSDGMLFFSYPWLVRRLLNDIGVTKYDRYIKALRCKKRNQKYEELYQKLLTCNGIRSSLGGTSASVGHYRTLQAWTHPRGDR